MGTPVLDACKQGVTQITCCLQYLVQYNPSYLLFSTFSLFWNFESLKEYFLLIEGSILVFFIEAPREACRQSNADFSSL